MITRLHLKNWKTHLDSNFDFTGGVNALLGVMGCGKSSTLDAICFALFGTFPALQQRRIKVEDIIMNYPQKQQKSEVRLHFVKEGQPYFIKRVIERGKGTTYSEIRKGDELLEAPQTQRVTEVAEKILKIDYELFSQVIYGEQNRLDYFLEIPRGQRMKKVDELLRINKFETARSNTVTLVNRLRQRRNLRRETISNLESQLKEVNLEKTRAELKQKRDELEGLRKETEELKINRTGLADLLKDLKAKKERFEELNEAKTALKGKIEQLESQLKEADLTELRRHDSESISKELDENRKTIEEQKSMEKELISLNEQESSLKERAGEEKKKLDELESGRSKEKELEKIEKEISELEKKHEELLGSIAKRDGLLTSEKKAIGELMKTKDTCPVCENKLDGKKRDLLIEKKDNAISGLKKEIKNVSMEKAELGKRISAMKGKREELVQYKDIEKKIFEQKKQLDMAVSRHASVENKIKLIKEKFSSDLIELSEKKLKELEKIKELLEFLNEKEKMESSLENIDSGIVKLEFNPRILEEKEMKFNEVDKKLAVCREKTVSLDSILKEKRETLDNLEKQAGLIREYQKEVERLEDLDIELSKFKSSLEETQVLLREEFISSVNYVMSELWQALYPYGDYTDIKLHIDGDYILKIRNVDGFWVNVEGFASGGERTTASLALRLALAMVLAPNVKLLILDEPTHNLDKNAIEELSETLRTKINELAEQVFLITHDDALEGAVTGKLYRLNREDSKKDFTRVVEG